MNITGLKHQTFCLLLSTFLSQNIHDTDLAFIHSVEFKFMFENKMGWLRITISGILVEHIYTLELVLASSKQQEW